MAKEDKRRKRIDAEYIPPRRKRGSRMVGAVSEQGGEDIEVEFRRGKSGTRGSGFLGRARLLWRLLRDKDYRLGGAVKLIWLLLPFYVLSPVDIVPDALPGLGIIDDLFLLTLALGPLDRELKRYARFQGRKHD